MPAYTLQRHLPLKPSAAASHTPQIFSEDYDPLDSGTPPMPPPTDAADMDAYRPSFHAHPRQQVLDRGPQIRQSRLPIFKQVRSMLHKPPTLATPGNPKWDEYTGELSDTGKPAHVQPSTYVSPYDGAFKARRNSLDRPNKLRKNPTSPERNSKAKRNPSPVSVLRDADPMETAAAAAHPQQQNRNRHGYDDTDWSPVSPVSPIQDSHYSHELEQDTLLPREPSPMSSNVQRAQLQPPQTPAIKLVARKPAPRSPSATENRPPRSSSQSGEMMADLNDHVHADRDALNPDQKPTSHFSWTTYAPSLVPGRASTDTRHVRQSSIPEGEVSERSKSHFSWSTVATNVPARPDSPPPSPPPPIPSKFSNGPPVQSILSRRRPVQRTEQEEWTPPVRKSSAAASHTTNASTTRSIDSSGYTTPASLHPAFRLPVPPKDKMPAAKPSKDTLTVNTNGPGKALPLPPSLSPNHKGTKQLTHLEALLVRERDIVLQRRNVEKAIRELEKIEKASPMDVPFATVRDAQKRLAEHRIRLDEVKLEEREIGVAISRARRKEGEEEGLWVRRVTG